MSDNHGGSYRVGETGEVTQVERPTQDHPQGNRARNAQGIPLDVTGAPVPSAAPELPAAPPAAAPRARRTLTVLTDNNKE